MIDTPRSFLALLLLRQLLFEFMWKLQYLSEGYHNLQAY